MSTQSLSINGDITKSNLRTNRNNNNCYSKNNNILKSKNIFKSSCDRALKRKLKKYKLRRDGKEDQDVIDISQIFFKSLRIKSPNKNFCNNIGFHFTDFEESPKNYLFKMARRKFKTKPLDSNKKPENFAESNGTSGISPMNSQDIIQTDAFKLMMNSRNKSIGSNSPGRKKSIVESEEQEIIEKKRVKVKRQLILQKMAEAKGSLERQEKEILEEKCIQMKMHKRAERLKMMVVNNKTKPLKRNKDSKTAKGDELRIEIEDNRNNPSKTNRDIEVKKNVLEKQHKTLKLVNIFDDTMEPKSVIIEREQILKEEDEFVKKLSPSLRKKENMLSYFKKIEKQTDLSVNTESEVAEELSETVIKVKITKNKKAIKKKNCLRKDSSAEVLKDHNENPPTNNPDVIVDMTHITKSENTDIRRKRKRKENSGKILDNKPTVNADAGGETVLESRPKRQIKKPVKYVDDLQLSSSDEEFHITTPKKRKQVDCKIQHASNAEICSLSDEEYNKTIRKSKKGKKYDVCSKNKPSKLAPIFAPKSQLNRAEMEAKQKFLYSGVPDQLKKVIAQQKALSTEVSNEFPVVVHIQQVDLKKHKETKPFIVDLPEVTLHSDVDDHVRTCVELQNFKKMLNLNTSLHFKCNIPEPVPKLKTRTILQNIKDSYPRFPVYRTFRSLKGRAKGEFKDCEQSYLENSIEVINGIIDLSNENPANLNWVDKYKPISTSQLLGNFETIREFKKWLLQWTESDAKTKSNAGNESSDSSDFYYESESNSKDCIRTINNLAVITGPVGSGKTSSVYTVASELAIKVIEVNASSKRTGKVMLQDLQEATQSHKVNRGTSSGENSQKSQEVASDTNKKSKGRPKKSVPLTNCTTKHNKEILSQPFASQDNLRTGMSLILIDDADIIFEQDDGFSSAISQLIHSSKRPVILVTSSESCPHLQRFIQCGKVMHMRPFSPRMLGTWLDLMCLAENRSCIPGLGSQFLDYFKGDIRKTINYLQFYMTSNNQDNLSSEEASQNSENHTNIDDENSAMSWADDENRAENNTCQSPDSIDNEAWKCFINKESSLLQQSYSGKSFNLWWSLPSLLHPPKTEAETLDQKHIEAFADAIDSLSVSDFLTQLKPDTKSVLTSRPWSYSESDSVSEQENKFNFCQSHEIQDEILHSFVLGSIEKAQGTIQCKRRNNIEHPDVTAKRERDNIISYHKSVTSLVNPSAALDRRALALDYWSSCRSICRIEKTKTDTVSKRHNRFNHYLKSFNHSLRSDSFDNLGDSLCSNKHE